MMDHITDEGRTIATIHPGTEHEVRVVVDRITRGYISRFRAEFIRARDEALLFDVDERALGPDPSVPVMEALLAAFGAGVRAGERQGYRDGTTWLQRRLREALGITAPGDEAADALDRVYSGLISRAEAERIMGIRA